MGRVLGPAEFGLLRRAAPRRAFPACRRRADRRARRADGPARSRLRLRRGARRRPGRRHDRAPASLRFGTRPSCAACGEIRAREAHRRHRARGAGRSGGRIGRPRLRQFGRPVSRPGGARWVPRNGAPAARRRRPPYRDRRDPDRQPHRRRCAGPARVRIAQRFPAGSTRLARRDVLFGLPANAGTGRACRL